MNVTSFWSARVEVQGGYEYIYGVMEMEKVTPDNKNVQSPAILST